MNINNNIEMHIRKNGLQKMFVAKKVGVSRETLKNWIDGRTYPRIDQLFKLADLLNCEITDLYIKI